MAFEFQERMCDSVNLPGPATEERSGIPMPRAAPKQPNQLNFDQVEDFLKYFLGRGGQ